MTLLRSATLADGTVTDVRLAGATIAEVGVGLVPATGEDVRDLDGWMLLPAPAEPHAHMDKAFTADRAPNLTGDLMGAVQAFDAMAGDFGTDDIHARAKDAALRLLASGCTAVRSHVNVGGRLGLRAVDALVAVRSELAPFMDIQLVALQGMPTDLGLIGDALDRGVDVVGGCPDLDDDPLGSIDQLVALAADRGLALDLHMDETIDPTHLWVDDLADAVGPATGRGRAPTVTASHCVSLGMQSAATQARVAEMLATADVAVVTLPQTNLFLQSRGQTTAAPRGLTAIPALLDAGVTLAGGADNVQDPFNPMGRSDPLETAALLVMAGHLSPTDAYATVSAGSRRALGLPPVTITPGSPAELLAVRTPTLRAALADAPADRMVFAKGRLAAHTTTTTTLADDLAPTVL